MPDDDVAMPDIPGKTAALLASPSTLSRSGRLGGRRGKEAEGILEMKRFRKLEGKRRQSTVAAASGAAAKAAVVATRKGSRLGPSGSAT